MKIRFHNLKLERTGEIRLQENHVFSYAAFGKLTDFDGTKTRVLIGFSDKDGNHPVGIIRYKKNSDDIESINYGSIYRSEINLSGLATKDQWNKAGHELKSDAHGDGLYKNRRSLKYEKYYGIQELA